MSWFLSKARAAVCSIIAAVAKMPPTAALLSGVAPYSNIPTVCTAALPDGEINRVVRLS